VRIKEKRILKYEKRSQSDAASVPRKKTGEGGRQIVSEQSGRERAREGWLTAWSESVWLRPCQFLRGTVLDRSDAKHAPPPRPPFGRSRGCRSQTVGADCLTMCHPRDRTNLTGSEREREGDRFLIAVMRNMLWSALFSSSSSSRNPCEQLLYKHVQRFARI